MERKPSKFKIVSRHGAGTGADLLYEPARAGKPLVFRRFLEAVMFRTSICHGWTPPSR
jgi:hypothetical protein